MTNNPAEEVQVAKDACPKCGAAKTPLPKNPFRMEEPRPTYQCGTIDDGHFTQRQSDRCKLAEQASKIARLEQQLAAALKELAETKGKHEAFKRAAGGAYDSLTEEAASLLKRAEEAEQQLAAALKERDELKLRLLSAAGDDLCRLTQEEIKAYSSGAVKIPPRDEFISSCERFHAQIAKESGVLENCLTLAQLIAENQRLSSELAASQSEAANLRAANADLEEACRGFQEQLAAALKRAEESPAAEPSEAKPILISRFFDPSSPMYGGTSQPLTTELEPKERP